MYPSVSLNVYASVYISMYATVHASVYATVYASIYADVTKKKKIIPTKTGCLLLSISILADTGALHPSYEKLGGRPAH